MAKLASRFLRVSALFLTLTSSAIAGAASLTRNASTGTTPDAKDFPSSYNSHPDQVGYGNALAEHMFRETIPIVCERGMRLSSLGMTFSLVKINEGKDAGDNDTMSFWLGGVRKYELNVGQAAKVGMTSVISLDLGHLPAVGTGPATTTALYSSYPPSSLLADVRASKQLSFAIQDDTNIDYATVNYTCERDPDYVPPQPIAVDPCCPPWNSALLSSSLQYVGSGGVSSPYTLKFSPVPGLLGALQAYLNYLNSTNAALTNLNIQFQLYDQGTGSLPLPAPNNGTPVGPVSGLTLTANAASIRLHTNYNPNTPAIFTGVSTPGTLTAPSSYPMQVGRWYLVHTGIWTDKIDFFDKARCANVDVFMRVLIVKGRPVIEVADRKSKILRPVR